MVEPNIFYIPKATRDLTVSYKKWLIYLIGSCKYYLELNFWPQSLRFLGHKKLNRSNLTDQKTKN